MHRLAAAVALAGLLWQPAAGVTARIAACGQDDLDTDGVICQCVHEPGATCPMHRRAAAAPADASQRRICAGCDQTTDVLLTGVSAEIASLPLAPFSASVPPATSCGVADPTTAPRALVRPPASPPPRA